MTSSGNLPISTVGAQPRKLLIKNFKGQWLPENYENEAWLKLRDGIRKIFAGKSHELSLEALYRTCENVCRCRMGHTIYSKLYAECQEQVAAFSVKVLNRMLERPSEEELLSFLDDTWSTFAEQVKLVCHVCLYLDRVYVMNRPELASVWDFCRSFFRSQVLSEDVVKQALIMAIIGLVERDRKTDGTGIAKLLGRTFKMLGELDVIDGWMKEDLFRCTSQFYKARAAERLASLCCAEYVEYAQEQLGSETARLRTYGLDEICTRELLGCTKNALFVDPFDSMVVKNLDSLLTTSDERALRIIYGLAEASQVAERLALAWGAAVRRIGISLLQKDSQAGELVVADLLELKSKADKLVSTAFNGDHLFANATQEGLESVVDSHPVKPAELIARYADYVLRGNLGEDVTEEQLSAQLDQILVLFRYLQSKDVFEMAFKKGLCRRLLFHRMISTEAEKSFVARLRAECGSAYVSRLEGMFKDIETSKDIMSVYRKSLDSGTKRSRLAAPSYEFGVNVITSGLWPYPPILSGLLDIPADVLSAQESFAKFYCEHHKGRILTWHHGLGYCVLKASFTQGSKELQLIIPQALVLLQFGNADVLSFGELQRKTGLDVGYLERVLYSLSLGRAVLLRKLPLSKEILPTDSFAFNADFSSRHYRIRINMPDEKSSADTLLSSGTKDPTEAVASADRVHRVDAAIVRILKAMKRLDFVQLIQLVSDELGMTIAPAEASPRLSVLLEREYISKESDAEVYSYLA